MWEFKATMQIFKASHQVFEVVIIDFILCFAILKQHNELWTSSCSEYVSKCCLFNII